ncbi:integrase/recombinase XerD [Microcella alkaliphila]|uniref:Integrase/recombinase XerD n=1 Tax=Microcella alkaliphila TaxID=279828 RepID=A0A4Q7TFP2_9MICO|nr:site-specific integrase [Microcella alkaliphila]RZT59305.1 integrase/recombinase XerD [Microcella alkaliphila]
MNTDEIIDYWAAYMRAQHCTERTIRERGIFIRAMLRHTGAASILDITKQQLVLFLGRPDLTGKTKQNYRSTLHTFFTWMQDEGLRLDNPAARLPRPRVEPTEPNPVSTEDIQNVLQSGIYGPTVMKVLLYSYQGLRASEIAAVRGDNIDWDAGTILTAEGKGRKIVTRPLHSIVLEHAIAEDYPRDDWWFPGLIPGEHVRGKSVSNTLCAAFRRAGIAHRAHQMRAWHGTTLLELGADSIDVQHSLRHSDGQSMRAYVRPSQDRIRAAMERLPRVSVPTRPAGRSDLRRAPANRAG